MPRKNTYDDITVGSIVTIRTESGEFTGRALYLDSTKDDANWIVVEKTGGRSMVATPANVVRIRETGQHR
jgi:hypothetical protein